MYEINLDFDPTTVGFDAREINKNDDGTYTVTRRFIHAEHYHDVEYNCRVEAYCPCLTDNVEIYSYQIPDHRGRITYGVSYITNEGEKQSIESRNYSNSMVKYLYPLNKDEFNGRYDTHIEDKSQGDAATACVYMVNDHPANTDSRKIREYFEKHHIVYGKSAPISPEEDPFLPEAFKKMIGLDG